MDDLFPARGYLERAKYCRRLPEYRSLWFKDWLRLKRRCKFRPRSPRGSVRLLHQRRKMLKAIHDLYSRDETFLDHLAHDLDNDSVWFNCAEFARWHDLNGRKILSILTSDTRSRGLNIKVNNESPELLNRSVGVFFCRAQDIKGSWQSGAPIRIDGRQYTVSEARLLQDQVWRISLEANK